MPQTQPPRPRVLAGFDRRGNYVGCATILSGLWAVNILDGHQRFAGLTRAAAETSLRRHGAARIEDVTERYLVATTTYVKR